MNDIFLIVVIVILALALAWVLLARRGAGGAANTDGLLLLQRQMADLAKIVDSRLGESRREMQDAVHTQFSESQKLINEMQRSLVDVAREQTKTNEATRQFMTIAEQLGSLEKTLKHQKQRGNWGEASLELILKNTLAPGQYTMQYEFANKAKVDAIITTKEGFIPIDAKFSLDNYNRLLQATDDRQREELEKEFKNDLKKRIDETAKYIKTDEGIPFAFMYIPAEGIYYDLLVNEVGSVKVNTRNLIDYAYNEKKVIIVSPTTFMAYLQSVLFGFRAYALEESVNLIMKRIDELSRHLKAYEEYFLKVGNNLSTTFNSYNLASSEFRKIDKDITRITGTAPGLEPILLEKPLAGE